jgi:hypothetical protein
MVFMPQACKLDNAVSSCLAFFISDSSVEFTAEVESVEKNRLQGFKNPRESAASAENSVLRCLPLFAASELR